jgi:hypothetical protein
VQSECNEINIFVRIRTTLSLTVTCNNQSWFGSDILRLVYVHLNIVGIGTESSELMQRRSGNGGKAAATSGRLSRRSRSGCRARRR